MKSTMAQNLDRHSISLTDLHCELLGTGKLQITEKTEDRRKNDGCKIDKANNT